MALQTKQFTAKGKSLSGVPYTYILDVTENSVDTANNRSSVTVKAILKAESFTFNFSRDIGVSCTLNGKEIFKEIKYRSFSSPGSQVLYTWSGNVDHTSDGTLRLKVGGKLWKTDSERYTPPELTIIESDSNYMTLTAIARESTAGAADAYIGSNATISVKRNSSSYSHVIAVTFGNISGYIGSDWKIVNAPVKLTDTSIAFEIPYEFYNEIPNAISNDCTLTITTYNGTTQVGNSKESKFKCLANPADCSPEVEGTVEDVNPNTLALTENAKKLVKFFSTAKCTIDASGKHSATIRDVQIGNTVLNAGDNTLLIDKVETTSIVFSAIDSRGFRGSYTDEEVSLVPYIQLTNEAVCKRIDPTSGKAVLTFAGDWFNGSFGAKNNSLTLKYQIGDSEVVDVQPQLHLNKYEAVVDLEGLDYSRSYTITVTVSDKLDTAEKVLVVQNGIPVFDWGENDFAFHVPVTVPQVNGVCMASQYIVGKDIYLRTNLKTWEGYGDNTQSVLFFGGSVYGLITADDRGGILWDGTPNVSVIDDSAGVVKITLPFYVTYSFVAISSEPISFKED